MSTTKDTTSEVKENRVEITIPKGYAHEETNLFISVNGKNYILPRGKTTKVPEAVKREFERSQRAQEKLDATIERLQG